MLSSASNKLTPAIQDTALGVSKNKRKGKFSELFLFVCLFLLLWGEFFMVATVTFFMVAAVPGLPWWLRD